MLGVWLPQMNGPCALCCGYKQCQREVGGAPQGGCSLERTETDRPAVTASLGRLRAGQPGSMDGEGSICSASRKPELPRLVLWLAFPRCPHRPICSSTCINNTGGKVPRRKCLIF